MFKTLKDNKKKILCFFILSLLFKPLWLFNNQNLGIAGDDMSYWLHSATIALDYDLNYKNDYNLESNIFNPETNVPSHPPGAGYIASPFVFLFSQLDKVTNLSVENTRTNPVKSFAYLGFFVSGLFYTYMGTKLISKIVKKYKNKYTGLVLFCGLVSTLIHYVSTRFLMAHAIEFFLCCSLVYLFEKNEGKHLNNRNVALLLLVYFFLSITRPSTFLYSIVLVFFYRKKINFSLKSNLIYSVEFLGLSTFYILLSRKLYQRNFMLLNTYGENMNEYSSTLNSEQLFSGFLRLPALFLSPNMGIAFSTPVVFLTLILLFNKQFRRTETKLNIFYLFIFFSASFLPLLVWQGREVAYGQRLLIGIIPMCILLTSKYLYNYRLVFLTKLLTAFSYIGYFFFYSSEKLTLKSGLTLWGTQVGFTAENYYIEVIKALASYETILSALVRNIYAVNFFKLFNLRSFFNDSTFLSNINIQKVNNFLSLSDVYFNLENTYLITVNVAIFLFSYYYTKLLFNLRD